TNHQVLHHAASREQAPSVVTPVIERFVLAADSGDHDVGLSNFEAAHLAFREVRSPEPNSDQGHWYLAASLRQKPRTSLRACAGRRMFAPMASVDRLAAVRALRDISLLLQLKGENAFRCRAYEVAADRLAGLSEDLGTLVAQGKLQDLPGIGPALAEKIPELAATGRIHLLDKLRADFTPRILELMKLPELGPKKVAALWRELQIG